MALVSRSLGFGFLVVLIVSGAGCFNNGGHGSRTDSSDPDSAWIGIFKSELKSSEQALFSGPYLQKADDPFYLKEVVPQLAPGKAPSTSQKAALDQRKADYVDSWPVLSAELGRTQLIFGIAAVLPSLDATMALGKALPAGVDVENAASILKFRSMVEAHTVFNAAGGRYELAPEARSAVVDLAAKIAVRTLALIREASGLDGELRQKLDRLATEIRLLNPAAAVQAGQPVSPEAEPFIEDPTVTWKSLDILYRQLFGALDRLGKGSSLDEVARLEGRETELLQKLQFSTNKQFELTKTLCGANP